MLRWSNARVVGSANRACARGFGKRTAAGNLHFMNGLGLNMDQLHAPQTEQTQQGQEMIKSVTHVPVMLEEVTSCVKLQVNKLRELRGNSPVFMVDCCVGTGGHSLHLLKAFPQLVIAGLDWDPNMISTLEHRTKGLEFLKDSEGRNRLHLKQINFSKLGTLNRKDLFPDYTEGSRALKPKVDILKSVIQHTPSILCKRT